MIKLITCWLIILIGFSTAAQQIEPKHTFNIELGLPNGMVNKPFKDYMQGLINFAPYYQFTMKNSLSFGAGIRYSYFGVSIQSALKNPGWNAQWRCFCKNRPRKISYRSICNRYGG
jgi:hypothetical protein